MNNELSIPPSAPLATARLSRSFQAVLHAILSDLPSIGDESFSSHPQHAVDVGSEFLRQPLLTRQQTFGPNGYINSSVDTAALWNSRDGPHPGTNLLIRDTHNITSVPPSTHDFNIHFSWVRPVPPTSLHDVPHLHLARSVFMDLDIETHIELAMEEIASLMGLDTHVPNPTTSTAIEMPSPIVPNDSFSIYSFVNRPQRRLDPMSLHRATESPVSVPSPSSSTSSLLDYAPSVASVGVLRASIRRRKRDASYLCLICDQSFTTKKGLTNHRNSHLGLRPYECQRCRRGFVTKHDCKRHAKSCSGVSGVDE